MTLDPIDRAALAQTNGDPEVIEPEVLPPDPEGSGSQRRKRPGADRLKYVVIGIVLDLLDFLSPLPTPTGFVAGVIAAFLLLGLVGVPMGKRMLISIAAGIYCILPGTGFLPLGTLLGTFLKLR